MLQARASKFGDIRRVLALVGSVFVLVGLAGPGQCFYNPAGPGDPIDLSVTTSSSAILTCESVTITATAFDKDIDDGIIVDDVVDQFTWTGIGTAQPTYSYDQQTHISTSTVTVRWNSPGIKTITVTADDHFFEANDEAVTAQMTVSAELLPDPPIRAGAACRTSTNNPWQVSNLDVGAGTTVLFKGDSELDPSVDEDASQSDCVIVNDTISSYSWNFGDGQTATGHEASYTYNTEGTYIVSLVVDDGGSVNDDPASAPAQLGIRVFANEPGAPTVTEPWANGVWCSLIPIVRWTGETHDSFQVRIGQVNDPESTTWDWDSATVASDESKAACPVTLAAETQYYVFVREHNVLGWGPWSATGHGFMVEASDNPRNEAVTPDSGTFTASSPESFIVSYSDSCRWENIGDAQLLIDDSSMDKAFACLVKYDQDTNTCWLADDSGVNWLGGYEPGTANDIENDQVIVHVADTSVGGDDNTLTVTWNLEFKNAFAGAKKLALAVVNDSGMADPDNFEEFGEITVTPDTDLVSTITSPANGAHVTSVPVTISGTASSANGISKVEISTDRGETWAEATGTTTWSYTWSDAADGHYTIKSRAYDSQQAVETPGTGIDIVVDTVLPTSTIYQPANGAEITGDKISISGSAYDPASEITKVEISVNDGPWQQALGTSAWGYDYPVTVSGEYNIKSRATDASGQVEVPGGGITVTVTFQSVELAPPPSSVGDDPLPVNVNSNLFEAQRTQKLGDYTTINLCTGQILTAIPLVSWKSAGDLGIDFTIYHMNSRPDRLDAGKDNWMHSYQLVMKGDASGLAKLYHPSGELKCWQWTNTANGVRYYLPLYGNVDTLTYRETQQGNDPIGYYLTTKDHRRLRFTLLRDGTWWALTAIEQPDLPTHPKIELIYNPKHELIRVDDPNGRHLHIDWNLVGPDQHDALLRVSTSQYFYADGSSPVGPPQSWLFNYTHDGRGDLNTITMPHKETGDQPLIPSWAKIPSTYDDQNFNTPTSSLSFGFDSLHRLGSVQRLCNSDWQGYKLNYIGYQQARFTGRVYAGICNGDGCQGPPLYPGFYEGTVESVSCWNEIATDSKITVALKGPYRNTPQTGSYKNVCGEWTYIYTFDMYTYAMTTVTDPRGHQTVYEHRLWHGPQLTDSYYCSNQYCCSHIVKRQNTFGKYGCSDWSGFRIYQIKTTDNAGTRPLVENFDWFGRDVVNGANRLDWYKDPLGRYTWFGWDANGNLTRVLNPNLEHTDIHYTTYNKPDKITEPTGRITVNTYDENTYQLTKTVIDPKSENPTGLDITIDYEHNTYGNLTKVTGPYYGPNAPTGVAITQYAHDPPVNPNPSRVTDPCGRFTDIFYTHLGWKRIEFVPTNTPTKTQSPDTNACMVWDYDKAGKPYYQWSEGDTDSRTIYNSSGAVAQIYDANGNLTKLFYDDHGRVQQTSRQFDTDQSGNPLYLISFQNYDAASNPTTSWVWYDSPSPGYSQWYVNYSYDDMNRLWQINFPPSQEFPVTTATITYDALGKVYEKTDCRGCKAKYTYDYTTQRLSNIQFFKQDGTPDRVVNYQYYTGGLLWKVCDWVGPGSSHLAREYTYDAVGRVTKEYRYDVGRRIDYDDLTASGKPNYVRLYTMDSVPVLLGTYSYLYNADDSVKSVTFSCGTTSSQTTNFSYTDPRGRLSKITYPDGSYVVYQYKATGPTSKPEARSLVAALMHRNNGFSYDYIYTYDKVGNVLTLDDHYGTVRYTYDDAYRLLNEINGIGGGALSYEYDPRGNRTKKTAQNVLGFVSGETDYEYDYDGRLTSQSGADGAVSYLYDADGNLTRKTAGASVWQYAYDTAGNLITVTPPSPGPVSSFLYNSDGERVRTTDGQWTKLSIYSGGNLLQETSNDQNHTIFAWYNPGISQTVGSDTRYFHHDLQGSTVGLTGGASAERTIYEAFGNQIRHTGPTTFTPFRYIGNEGYYSDPDTGGLIKLGARYYDPKIGRFITKDPIRDGLNWYAYCGNNPVNAVDPSGLEVGSADPWDTNPMSVTHAPLPDGWSTHSFVDAESDAQMSWRICNEGRAATTSVGGGRGFWSAFGSTVSAGWKWVTGLFGGGSEPVSGVESGFGAAVRTNRHHIVEQRNIRVNGMSPELIHSEKNTRLLPEPFHQDVSAFYSSKRVWLTGPGYSTVRQWMTPMSFNEQYRNGQNIMKYLRTGKWPE